MKRIHILYNCYWGSGMSGGDRRLIEILRRWQSNNSIEVLLYTTSAFLDLLTNEDIHFSNVFITDENKKTNILLAYYKRQKNCEKKLLKELQVGDVVYSPTDIMPDVLPAVKAKKKFGNQIKWGVITYHIYEAFYKRPGNIFTNYLSGAQQKYDIRVAKRYSDMMMSTSAVVLKTFEKRNWDPKRLKLIDCAVDLEAIRKADESITGYDAVFLARLNYSKGIMELPEIWKKVCKTYPKAKLAIIGKGSEEIVNELKEKISVAGVEKNVELLGFMETSQAFSLMKHSKLFLFTSHEEGWGMAIAEAMVCGLPVVAYDLEVYRYIFKKGIVVSPLLDTDEMAKQVCTLLSNDSLCRALGKDGKEYIEANYSFEKTANKELDFLINMN